MGRTALPFFPPLFLERESADYDVLAMSPKAALILPLLLGVAAPALCQTTPSAREQIEQHTRMAQQYLHEQRPDLAIPELQKVTELDPQNVDARINLGVLLFFRGDYRGAAPQLRAALEIKPDLWKQRALLGLAEAQLQDKDASRADLEAAFPHLTEAKFQLDVGNALIADYTATGDLDKAATVVTALLAARPTDPSLLYLSYRLYSDLAGQSMLTLALSAPESAEMHQVMARELARHGDNDAAIANYREAIRINPRLPGLHLELGDLLRNSPDEKLQSEAGSEFEAALAVNPRDEKAELSLGMIADKSGDAKNAYAHDSRAVELDPNDSDGCTELAKVLIEMGQSEKAQHLLEHAVQVDPTNYIAHYRLVALYRQQGKMEEAKQHLADYQKYKKMKDTLEKVFRDMRVASGQRAADDDARAMQ
jgi:tetratricopeptide (TPR) repeat protein